MDSNDDAGGDVDDDDNVDGHDGSGFTGNSDPSTSAQCSGVDGLKVWSPVWNVKVRDKRIPGRIDGSSRVGIVDLFGALDLKVARDWSTQLAAYKVWSEGHRMTTQTGPSQLWAELAMSPHDKSISGSSGQRATKNSFNTYRSWMMKLNETRKAL